MTRSYSPIGPKDSILSAVVGIQAFLIVSAVTIEAIQLLGFEAGGGLTVALILGIAASGAIETIRRRVLFGAVDAHDKMASAYRKIIRNMLPLAAIGLVLSICGLASDCFGHACNDFDKFLLGFALFLSFVGACVSPLTRSLARHAVWLRPATAAS